MNKPKGFMTPIVIIGFFLLVGFLAWLDGGRRPALSCFIEDKGWSDDYRKEAIMLTPIKCADFSFIKLSKELPKRKETCQNDAVWTFICQEKEVRL